MGKHSHNTDPIDIAVQLSEEIDAEEVLTPVDESFERFVGSNLTSASFSPDVETATDAVLALDARASESSVKAMLGGAERAIQARREEIAANDAWQSDDIWYE